MSRPLCNGPVEDRETGAYECRQGGPLDVPCPKCRGTGLVPMVLLHITTRGLVTCPTCHGCGIVDRCPECQDQAADHADRMRGAGEGA